MTPPLSFDEATLTRELDALPRTARLQCSERPGKRSDASSRVGLLLEPGSSSSP
jgi:hypothetical protein